jgi:hypothetical protein
MTHTRLHPTGIIGHETFRFPSIYFLWIVKRNLRPIFVGVGHQRAHLGRNCSKVSGKALPSGV